MNKLISLYRDAVRDDWDEQSDATLANMQEAEQNLLSRLAAGEEAVKEVERLKEEIEVEIMRLVGCGVAANQNTETTIKDRITLDSPYFSASYASVCNAVDREIALRQDKRELVEALNLISEITNHSVIYDITQQALAKHNRPCR